MSVRVWAGEIVELGVVTQADDAIPPKLKTWGELDKPDKIVDLGVISHRNMIGLQACQRRVDFLYFKIEIVFRSNYTTNVLVTNTVPVLLTNQATVTTNMATVILTNKVSIETTNSTAFKTTNMVLKMADFINVPDGPAVLGVYSYCIDGTPSPRSLFQINIQRRPPVAPRAEIMHFTPTNDIPVTSIESDIHNTRPQSADPPIPGAGVPLTQDMRQRR